MALTTDVIIRTINKDFYARRHFAGVFPRNVLPQIKCYPTSIIVNTHPMDKKGEHWLAFYFDKNRFCHFFDSFGFSPYDYEMENFLKMY